MSPNKSIDKNPNESLVILKELAICIANSLSTTAAINKIAKKYQKPENTIRTIYYRSLSPSVKQHGNQKLTDSEETQVLGMILAHTNANITLNRSQVIAAVRQVYFKKQAIDLDGWYTSFVKRHSSQLVALQGKEMKAARLSSSTMDELKSWLLWWPQYLKEKGYASHFLINADETRIIIERGKNKRVLAYRGKNTAIIPETVKGKASTYIPFVACDGRKIMEVFVIPLKNQSEAEFKMNKIKNSGRLNSPVYYCFSESGYLSEIQWLPIIHLLNDQLKKISFIGKPILIMDNLGVHKTHLALEIYMNCCFDIVFFPANLSHLLQPCDDKIFACFKQILKAKYFNNLICIEGGRRDAGALLTTIALEVKNKITSNVIVASFRDTGMFPFNAELILERANNLVKFTENVENQSVKNAAMLHKALIQSSTTKTNAVDIKVTPKTNKIYTGLELFLESSEKIKSKAAKAKLSAQKKRDLQKKRELEEVYWL